MASFSYCRQSYTIVDYQRLLQTISEYDRIFWLLQIISENRKLFQTFAEYFRPLKIISDYHKNIIASFKLSKIPKDYMNLSQAQPC